jgi:hypothetical protein
LRLVLRPRLHLLVRRTVLERLAVLRRLLARVVAFVVEVVAPIEIGALERLLRRRVRILLRELRLRRDDQALIMFGVLEITFRRHGIAGGLGVARELCVFLGDVVSGSADLHVRAVRLVHPRHRIVATAIASAHAILVVIVMVLSVSHHTLSLVLCGNAALRLLATARLHAETKHKAAARSRFGCVDCVTPGSRLGYAHKACRSVFTNLETNSALTRISFPLASRSRLNPRATIGEASDPGFCCRRSSEPASQTALRSHCALPPPGRNARPGSNLARTLVRFGRFSKCYFSRPWPEPAPAGAPKGRSGRGR